MAFIGCHMQLYGWWGFSSESYCPSYFKIIRMESILHKSDIGKSAELKTEKTGQPGVAIYSNLKFLAAGFIFGILLIKGEVISWFRIQEMFHLQSFHMYGIIGSAIMTGMISIFLIRKFHITTINREEIVIRPKKFQ